MIERKQRAIAATHVVLDAISCALALLAAYYLRFSAEVIPVTKGGQELSLYTYALPLVVVVFPIVFSFQGLYRVRASRTFFDELLSVSLGSIVGTVVLSGLLLWFRPGTTDVVYSRATLAFFVVLAVAFTLTSRALVRMALQYRYRRGMNLERVLVAGSGNVARAVVERIRSHQELGFALVGFISDETEESLDTVPRLGSFDEVDDVVRRHNVDHVFVAVPHASTPAMMQLLDRLTRQVVSIHVIPDLLQFMALGSRVEDLDGLPTINLSETPLDGWRRLAKRVFDLIVASFALVLLSPLLAVVALLIWLEDRGPVFYRQLRMGLDGVAFEMLKFRSMRPDAEASTGAVWTKKDDDRRTRLGAWLRAWSVDELPQLVNVLKGEMSLVGPRPERPQFVEQFRDEFPHYMLRHKVRAGMTGWAQVHGWRGNTSIRARVEHDLYYIENWSFMLDLKILLMTVRHGFRNENAY